MMFGYTKFKFEFDESPYIMETQELDQEYKMYLDNILAGLDLSTVYYNGEYWLFPKEIINLLPELEEYVHEHSVDSLISLWHFNDYTYASEDPKYLRIYWCINSAFGVVERLANANKKINTARDLLED